MANEFNNHFTTIAKHIDAKLIKPNLHFSDHLLWNQLKKL